MLTIIRENDRREEQGKGNSTGSPRTPSSCPPSWSLWWSCWCWFWGWGTLFQERLRSDNILIIILDHLDDHRGNDDVAMMITLIVKISVTMLVVILRMSMVTMIAIKTTPPAEKRVKNTNHKFCFVFLTHCFQFFLSAQAALWWQFAPFCSLSHYSLTWHHHPHPCCIIVEVTIVAHQTFLDLT